MTENTDDRLRQVLSKIAPLERWDSSWSASGPKICWKFFRANPELSARLVQLISNFRGHTTWQYPDHCLEPTGGRTFMPPLGMKPSFPPGSAGSGSISREDISIDLIKLADEIELQLDLAKVEPMPFSNALLTREGLRQRGPFEDFEDGGQRTVFLIVNPNDKETLGIREEDLHLHFAPVGDEVTAIFAEILKTDPLLLRGRAFTDSERGQIEKSFPVLWKIADMHEDSYLSPQQAQILHEECMTLEAATHFPKALRGLDKLMRIGYWASTKNYGVLFSAP